MCNIVQTVYKKRGGGSEEDLIVGRVLYTENRESALLRGENAIEDRSIYDIRNTIYLPLFLSYYLKLKLS